MRAERRAAACLAALVLTAVLAAACSPGTPGGPGTRATGVTAPPEPGTTPSLSAPADLTAAVAGDLAALEESTGRRVGVYARDTGTGATVAYRADERFGYASTLKALAVGEVLAGRPASVLDEPLTVAPDDVAGAGHAPVTGDAAGTDLTIAALGAAAVSESDNGALNVLLRHLGGPAALQAALAARGDTTTRVDADEPELNAFTPGGEARTSTPRALAGGLATYALGDVLDPAVRETYVGWLTASTTGPDAIRAGTPDGWTVGDKTGTAGRYGSRNDIAVVWPPGRQPIVLAVLTDHPDEAAEPDDAVLAAAARSVLAAYPG
ncbi:class A beta-lactamase [Cellulomonas hominis]|uniref:Beta-lactamase n=1 Tax=Cellulomonas hominis TaxID=156981 RepID=A0A7Z8K3C3_9CELL|nr:class A beta-lactamase [Cellulomonas hominis]TKR26711.1 class A beta-lactamase [Cellulomonas hominis]